jgi:hypothetical protein
MSSPVRSFDQFTLTVPTEGSESSITCLAEALRIRNLHDDLRAGRIDCRPVTESGPLQVVLFAKEPRVRGWAHDAEAIAWIQALGWKLAGTRLLLQAAKVRPNLGDRRLVLAVGDAFTGPDKRLRAPCFLKEGKESTLTVVLLTWCEPRSRLFMAVRSARPATR